MEMPLESGIGEESVVKCGLCWWHDLPLMADFWRGITVDRGKEKGMTGEGAPGRGT